MKGFLEILFISLKASLCLTFTLFFGGITLIILMVSIANPQGFDWQIFLYTLLSIFIFVGVWTVPFIKTRAIIKVIFLILLCIYLYSPKIFPSVMNQLDYEDCIDTGICTEGLEIRTKDGLVKINKENCLKYNWEWYEEAKCCNIRYDKAQEE